MAPDAVMRSLTQNARRLLRIATDLPESFSRLLKRAGQGEFRMVVEPIGLDPIMKRLEEVANRLAFALVVSAFVIGLSMLLANTVVPEWFTWIARRRAGGSRGSGVVVLHLEPDGALQAIVLMSDQERAALAGRPLCLTDSSCYAGGAGGAGGAV